jgi:hypothetical protein
MSYPDFAESYYYARQPDMRILDGIWERIVDAAKGAALGTGTTMDFEVTGAVWNVLPNETLGTVMHRNLEKVGGFSYTPEEIAFAEEIRKTPDRTGDDSDRLAGKSTTLPRRCNRQRVDRSRGRQLERPDGIDDRGHICAWRAGAQLASHRVRRWDDRHEGDDGCREDDGLDHCRPVYRPIADSEGEGRVRSETRARFCVQNATR